MSNFTHPKEMNDKVERVSVLIRLKKETKEYIDKTAKRFKIPAAQIIARTLEDYVDWLRKQEKD